ncbi:MAG: outer membrane protein assembly factor BamD [Longimicrobiales bacterium]
MRGRVRGDVARTRVWGALACALALGACGSNEVPLAQLEPQSLWDRAEAEYRAGEWEDAIDAFQAFVFNHPTHGRIQEARYMLALSYFQDEQYVTAAQEFARLADDYPQGPWADDARFKTCDSYRALSPEIELDQEYTRAAIEHCESLLAYYPDSEFADDARAISEAMTNKLALKLFGSGEYYLRRNALDSAILTFEETVRLYPNTPVAPRALLAIVRAYEQLRYDEEAAEARQRLLGAYPQSEQAQVLRGASSADTTGVELPGPGAGATSEAEGRGGAG